MKCLCLFIILVYIDLSITVPVNKNGTIINTRIRVSNNSSVLNTRGIWDFVGDFIENSQWFPIQVNVPDIFGNIGNGISSFASGIIQRIPFLNRPTKGQFKPITMFFPIRKSNLTKDALKNKMPVMLLIPANNKPNTGSVYDPFIDDDIMPYP